MSLYDSSYTSLLQGVSQQLPKLRLPGQMSSQLNMVSDIVTNTRRRPGAAYSATLAWPSEFYSSTKAWDTDIAGRRVHIYLGTVLGRVVVMNEDKTAVLADITNGYLIAADPKDIRVTTVGNDFYFLNVNIKPTAVPYGVPPPNPATHGFFFIKAGAFSKSYIITVTTNVGVATLTYTTPNGTGAGDAAASTPEAIALALTSGANATALAAAGVGHTLTGAYVYFTGTGGVTSLSVASGSGSSYLQPSGASRVRIEGDLPAILPAVADGYIVAVGEQKLYKYYQYKAATTEWLESGIFGSPQFIANMPIRLTYDVVGNVWSMDTTNYEGRLAGDDETNPLPEFLTRGLSGMGAFQSRLVLLGGSKVYMSSSVNPKRFMRSTVTGLLDADPIAVGASANSSAEYQYAVPFQKDLLLFSRKYQALVPSSGQAVTPRTASVLVTSTYSMDTTSEPVPIGRTLLFPAPRSQEFFGFMEMVSSQYTDAQYVANDATAHLPKYMAGKCRFGVSSSVASMVLFGPSQDPFTLIVYEYQWDGDTKVQQAWHTWKFQYPVATAYFSNEQVNIVFVQNGRLIVATVDPKQALITTELNHRPFLDINRILTVAGNTVVIPLELRQFDPAIGSICKLTVASGPLAGEPVGIESYDSGTGTITTVRSFEAGDVYLGIPYRSEVELTPPVVRDQNGIKIEGTKSTVLRFGVSTKDSAEYKAKISDSNSEEVIDMELATLEYSSTELEPGEARTADDARAIVPARTLAATTHLVLYTEGTGELNITGIDYSGRFLQTRRRR